MLSSLPASAGFFLGSLFDSEDGGNIFLQNVRLSLSCHNVTAQNTMLSMSSFCFSVCRGATLKGEK